MFDNPGERFHPVARIQIMHSSDHLVGRSVDMPTDDSVTIPMTSVSLQLLLVPSDKRNRGLHLGLDGLAQRKVVESPFVAIPVVKAVDTDDTYNIVTDYLINDNADDAADRVKIF